MKYYKTQKSLQKAVDSYFENNAERPTITGLSRHLGYANLKPFYQKSDREWVNDILGEARIRVAEHYEKQGQETTKSPAFAIFMLKNLGLGFVDAIDHSMSGKVKLKHAVADDLKDAREWLKKVIEAE